jgi:hypothetical protein
LKNGPTSITKSDASRNPTEIREVTMLTILLIIIVILLLTGGGIRYSRRGRRAA